MVRYWHVVHRRNKRLPPVAVAFKEFLRSEGAALIERLLPYPPRGAAEEAAGLPPRDIIEPVPKSKNEE